MFEDPQIKTIDELRAAIERVTFERSCMDMGWEWQVQTITVPGDGGAVGVAWRIRCSFRRPERDSGRVAVGFGRCSCRNCIFANANQRASERAVDSASFEAHAAYEVRFGRTVHRRLSVIQLADRGTPYEMRAEDICAAMSESFDEPIFLDRWTLPAGAFGDACGPS